MSDRLPKVDNLCTNPENHKHHICELQSAGKNDEIAALQVNPKYICGNCASVANQQGALCAPGPIDSEE